jgi:excinuclease ABC subunit A
MKGNENLDKFLDNLSKKYNFSINEPIKNLQPKILKIILYGEKQNGIIPSLEKRFNNSKNDWLKSEIESSFMKSTICNRCYGNRLSKSALSVTISGINITEFCKKNIKEALNFISNIEFTGKNDLISRPIIKEIKERLSFLNRVGLEYLTLFRSSSTLSGGEAQRIRLATQIGSALTGVIYVLDEPSIGLHQRDNGKLINTLEKLRDSGNTVIVVEHDEETAYAADYIVDFGPKAGVCGGEITAIGDIGKIKSNPESITGQYLSGKKQIPVPEIRTKGNGEFLEIIGANKNNLKNIDIKIPLGIFICVTGVSGSGKSTLVNEVIFKKLSSEIGRIKVQGPQNKSKTKILGMENLNKVINVDQSPIGKTPRSNPATYIGVFTEIRELFSQMPESLASGFTARRFSFNAKGGRCESCHGDGIIKIEMNFLPDLYVPCEICKGKRYNHETLKIKFRNKNINDVLEMTIQEAYEFFKNVPRISSKLKTLNEIGLGYIKLGQPATTLSGGEAQRIKLATELSRFSTGKTIYILDEPTTGLHIADVHKLITILRKFIDLGNTVLTIEHNLDFIKSADYIIDLGPEGGDEGGQILACGTPEEICLAKNSSTGFYLSKKLIKN